MNTKLINYLNKNNIDLKLNKHNALEILDNNKFLNKLVDVFNDWDSLDKGVMRIKRTGAGLDTSYAIATTARENEIPADALMAKDDLPPNKEYFRERYGALWVPGPSGDNGATQVKAETGFSELF